MNIFVNVYGDDNNPAIFLDHKYAEQLKKLLKYPEMLDVMDVLIQATESGKYEDENWLSTRGHSMSHKTNCDKTFHHLAMLYAGQILDKDSGLHHDLHVACRRLMDYVCWKRGIVHVEDKYTNTSTYNKDPKELDDNNCLSLDQALAKYKGSQYSIPEDKKEDSK